jgi:hypothetical protein
VLDSVRRYFRTNFRNVRRSCTDILHAEHDLGLSLPDAHSAEEAIRQLNEILLEAGVRKFPAYRVEGMRAHGMFLIALAFDRSGTDSVLLKLTMKTIHIADPRTRPEKEPRLSATLMLNHLSQHAELRLLSVEAINCLGLPNMMILVGERMVDCAGMSWDAVRKLLDEYVFLLVNKTNPGMRENYHVPRLPSFPQLCPYSIIEELERRARLTDPGGRPTGAVWRTKTGVPLTADGVARRVNIAIKSAGYTNCTANDLRAAAISKLIEMGVSGPDVARLVHHHPNSTTQYAHYRQTDRARGAVDTLLVGVDGRADDG